MMILSESEPSFWALLGRVRELRYVESTLNFDLVHVPYVPTVIILNAEKVNINLSKNLEFYVTNVEHGGVKT